jgi:hypothetical protein
VQIKRETVLSLVPKPRKCARAVDKAQAELEIFAAKVDNIVVEDADPEQDNDDEFGPFGEFGAAAGVPSQEPLLAKQFQLIIFP